MDRGVLLVSALLIAAGAAYVIIQPAQDAPDDEQGTDQASSETDFLDDAMSEVSNLFVDVKSAVGNPQVQAFLSLVRVGEGTNGPNGYRTMFGGGLFSDFADHPRRSITRSGYTSTAAGAYQFITTTWDEMRDKYDLMDFSPSSQDIAAVGLIKRRGALADVLHGRFRAAIDKCNKEWASLPGSPYGQPTLTYLKAQNVLAANGAIIFGGVA